MKKQEIKLNSYILIDRVDVDHAGDEQTTEEVTTYSCRPDSTVTVLLSSALRGFPSLTRRCPSPGKDGKPLGTDDSSTLTMESNYFIADGAVFRQGGHSVFCLVSDRFFNYSRHLVLENGNRSVPIKIQEPSISVSGLVSVLTKLIGFFSRG